MLRLALALALFALSAYFGVHYKKRCSLRAAFYSDLYDFAIFLSEQIAYSKTPLPTIFRDFALGKTGAFSELINAYSIELAGGTPEEYKLKFLNEAEKNEALVFFRGLGKADAERELAKLGENKQRIKSKKEITESEVKSKGKLYFKLAVIIGIALMIIVI